jgi:hypothetical protein
MKMEDKVLEFFKTFCDATRLRIAALLIEEALAPDEVAARLQIKASDVPRHLAKIERLGLLREEENRRCRLEVKSLEALSREILSGHRPTAKAQSNDENAEDWERQVIKNFSLPDGRLREIPMQPKKLQAVLRHVATVFEPGKRYSEKEVNQALKQYNEDYAFLRRGLIDNGLLEREPNGASYWKKQ